jgi:NAD(P)-dependent dehydrogenase (short-subunit alcohol dehydrogenase family)
MKNTSYRKMFDLTGKTAVVTGGTGILGKCFCAGLAEFGANVAIIDIDQQAVDQFAKEISSEYGVKALGVKCDVSSPNEVSNAIKLIVEQMGLINILHNNAQGKAVKVSFEKCTLEDWRMSSSVNEEGYFLMAQAVGKQMIKQKIGGSIIQTSSIYGIMAPDQRIYKNSLLDGKVMGSPAVYSYTKSGVLGLTKYLSTYWSDENIRVNSLTPGGVESEQNETFIKQYSNRIPMGRMALREEIVGALIYLASDASSYVTGQNIIVDGGLDAW